MRFIPGCNCCDDNPNWASLVATLCSCGQPDLFALDASGNDVWNYATGFEGGQQRVIYGIAQDTHGHIYLACNGIHQSVDKLHANGTLIETWYPSWGQNRSFGQGFQQDEENKTLHFDGTYFYWLHSNDYGNGVGVQTGDWIKKFDTSFNVLQSYGCSNFGAVWAGTFFPFAPGFGPGKIYTDRDGCVWYKHYSGNRLCGLAKVSNDGSTLYFCEDTGGHFADKRNSPGGLDTYYHARWNGGFTIDKSQNLAGNIILPVVPLFNIYYTNSIVNWCGQEADPLAHQDFCGNPWSTIAVRDLEILLGIDAHNITTNTGYQNWAWSDSFCDLSLPETDRVYLPQDAYSPIACSVECVGNGMFVISFNGCLCMTDGPPAALNHCGNAQVDFNLTSHMGLMVLTTSTGSQLVYDTIESLMPQNVDHSGNIFPYRCLTWGPKSNQIVCNIQNQVYGFTSPGLSKIFQAAPGGQVTTIYVR